MIACVPLEKMNAAYCHPPSISNFVSFHAVEQTIEVMLLADWEWILHVLWKFTKELKIGFEDDFTCSFGSIIWS